MRAAGYAVSKTVRRSKVSLLIAVAALALFAALAIDLVGHWQLGLRPNASGYGAMVYLAAFLQLQVVAAVLIMALFAVARVLTDQVSVARRVIIDNTAILLHYAVAQGMLGLALVHGFPRLVA
jgi:cytochrome c oxidase subunit I+III